MASNKIYTNKICDAGAIKVELESFIQFKYKSFHVSFKLRGVNQSSASDAWESPKSHINQLVFFGVKLCPFNSTETRYQINH